MDKNDHKEVKMEKIYNLKIAESELKNVAFKNSLVKLIGLRLKMQKNKPHYIISEIECCFLSKHYSWVNVDRYAKKKDRLKGEMGKYNGKRVIIRGRK